MKVFLILLVVATVLAGYVGWHLWRITPMGWPLKIAVTGLFMLWMVSFFVGFFVMERFPVKVAAVLYEVGTLWLVAYLYLLIIFFLADMATLFHLIPRTLLKDNAVGLLTAVSAVAAVMVLGGMHYRHKYREELTLTTTKPLEKPLTIVLASDLHIGYHNGRKELARWVDLINAEQPDIVLIGGDIIDRSLRPVLAEGCDKEFRRFSAPVFAVLGNHEFFSGVVQAERFYEDAGIVLLKDSVVHFKGLDIIGRKDRSARRRAAVKDLAAGLQGYTILLDHQPYQLEDAELAGIDFQFSGHTHRGQLWPLSWVTDFLYEKSWGHHQRGETRYYISSGLGIWGPKVRIGTRSEYMVLKLSHSVKRSPTGMANIKGCSVR